MFAALGAGALGTLLIVLLIFCPLAFLVRR